jgi:general secretion pathway protein G
MDKIIRKYRKSKGFTLVELLIVIIIIGILAGMMMLAAGSATDKAEATKIVSNLRNIKAAAVMYYADAGTWPSAGNITAGSSLDKYLDQTPDGYSIAAGTGTTVLVQAKGSATLPKWTTGSGIADKLNQIKDSAAITISGDVVSMPIN